MTRYMKCNQNGTAIYQSQMLVTEHGRVISEGIVVYRVGLFFEHVFFFPKVRRKLKWRITNEIMTYLRNTIFIMSCIQMFAIYQYMSIFRDSIRSHCVIRSCVSFPICFITPKIGYNINIHIESCFV